MPEHRRRRQVFTPARPSRPYGASTTCAACEARDCGATPCFSRADAQMLTEF